MRHPDFTCPDCDGNGTVRHGIQGANDPSTQVSSCDLCEGGGDLDASLYYDHCVEQMMDSRKAYHRYSLSSPSLAKRLREQSVEWCSEAKKARSVLQKRSLALARKLNGAGHITGLEA